MLAPLTWGVPQIVYAVRKGKELNTAIADAKKDLEWDSTLKAQQAIDEGEHQLAAVEKNFKKKVKRLEDELWQGACPCCELSRLDKLETENKELRARLDKLELENERAFEQHGAGITRIGQRVTGLETRLDERITAVRGAVQAENKAIDAMMEVNSSQGHRIKKLEDDAKVLDEELRKSAAADTIMINATRAHFDHIEKRIDALEARPTGPSGWRPIAGPGSVGWITGMGGP